MTRREPFLGRLGAGVITAWRSRLLRSSAGVGGLTVAELALGLVAAILLARALGAEGLGTYSLALAAVALAGLPVEFGLPNLVMREIAHHGVDREAGLVKGVLIFAVAVIVLMSAVIIPLALVFADTLAPGLDSAERSIIPVAVLLIPVSALCNTLGGALAGMQLVVIGAIPQKLVRPGVFAIVLGAAAVVEPGWLTPARAMALQLAATVAALAFVGVCFVRHCSDLLQRPRTQIFWRAWGLAMLRLGLSRGIHLAQGQVLLLLTGVLSSVENVGLLRIAQRGAALVSLGTTISIIVAAPEFARLNSEGRQERLQNLLTSVARANSGVAFIGLVGFVIGGHWLIGTLFGAEFIAAWSALVILAAAETIRALLGPGSVLMNMLRHEVVTALGISISLAASAVIAVALIPTYGTDGAALGIFFGNIAMSLFLLQKARRILYLDPTAFGRPVRRDRRNDKS